MVLIENCFCCSLIIGSGFFAVYLLITYLIAFAFELLWILESEIALPVAAVLLCAGYFALALFAALLIHGIATRTTVCLVAWMFAVTILTFPEAGMVIYMSIQYWRIETLYGMTELACWLARIIVNVVEIIIVHSLYSAWKEQELLTKRLRDLNMAAIPIPRDVGNPAAFQNNAFDNTLENYAIGMKRAASTSHLWTGTLPNNLISYDTYQFCTSQSEFNASIFVPHYLNGDNISQLPVKKSQSLMDLRLISDNVITPVPQQWPHPWLSQESLTETSSVILPNPNVTSAINPKFQKFASVDNLNDANKGNHIIRNRTGFYAHPIANYGVPIYYGPLDGPDFLIYKKKVDKLNSKNSLSNTSAEDVQKYRDVAL